MLPGVSHPDLGNIIYVFFVAKPGVCITHFLLNMNIYTFLIIHSPAKRVDCLSFPVSTIRLSGRMIFLRDTEWVKRGS